MPTTQRSSLINYYKEVPIDLNMLVGQTRFRLIPPRYNRCRTDAFTALFDFDKGHHAAYEDKPAKPSYVAQMDNMKGLLSIVDTLSVT